MKDKQIEKLIKAEEKRQKSVVNLIASENYVSKDVLEALGSVLTNKYAEGYPAARWYNGCEFVDEAENLAIGRAKELFGGDHINVQPHSGSQANTAVYMAVCEPGDTIMGMALPMGGHLTHGWKVNFSAKFFKPVQYGVDEKTGLLDYVGMEKLAKENWLD